MDIDIKIIGPGCKKCLEAADVVRMVAKEHGLPVQIEKISNTERMAEFGIHMTPAVVIDGDVKCAGRVPGTAEVLTWLKKAGGKCCR
ncbi:MAG: thioredoxin family protein [Desulfoarculaceae bacterium]|nr:thioredoxin family protein [Desulfoarculaceae bacterium]